MSNAVVRWLRRRRYGDPVIIVSGLPRSGTSMLMSMLEAGGVEILTDGERTADEDNPKGYFEHERVKGLADEKDKLWLSEARGKALKVISHLLGELPDENFYNVIFCRRDIREVIESQNKMLTRKNEPNPLPDEEAMELYRKHLLSVKLKVGSKPNFALMELNYADALRDPTACAKSIHAFLGGGVNVEAMGKVVKPELYRNRRESISTTVLLLLTFALGVGAPEAAQAYVGPGAGFAFLGSFLALFLAFLAAIVSLLTWPVRFLVRTLRRRKALGLSSVKRVIVLGLDGLDPTLVEQWMGEGHLPNLKKLSEQGSFSRLRTTYPSISPVAWSSFMTGVDPSRHNIFDFLSRDTRTYKPKLSSSEVKGPTRTMRVGNWLIPIDKPIVRNLRKSRAFWTVLGEHGIRCDILRIPLTFPPEKYAGLLLSAMCIPDLRGTQGSFTYYTTDPAETGATDEAPEATGGERCLVSVEDGQIHTKLNGPRDPIHKDHAELEIPFNVKLLPDEKACLLTIGREKHKIKEREYSPWIRLCFKSRFGVKAYGIARFYITKMDPHFGLYVTPINIDPAKPALPISWPGYYSVYLSKLIGEFATLGLAEDTWALNEGVIDEDAFLQQTLDHHEEREKMFFNAVEKSREGVVACVFDGTDRLQHMFFRYLDENHPANKGRDTEKYRNTILDMYARADEMVGRVLEKRREGDLFMVISDHGFQSFRRGVNINTWLTQNGLMFLEDGATECGDWFEHVDWSRTKAYAIGLGGIYINVRGREEHGCVAPGDEAQAVKQTIITGLTGLRDEEHDDVAINDVFDADEVYSGGPYQVNSPELIVGYNRGYRASWEGAVGRVTTTVLSDNTKSWSGDHCIDPRLVPGVLFCDHAITSTDPAIGDLAPTLLKLFGVGVPQYMTGKVLDVDLPNAAVQTS